MFTLLKIKSVATRTILISLALFVSACAAQNQAASDAPASLGTAPQYVIGPQDELDVFVWQNPDLSVTVPVRPDGRISTPLVDDMVAASKTSQELARDIEKSLSKYVKDPLVTVTVRSFNGPYDQQIRIVGQASEPKAIPYRNDMTVLDAIIAVGGMTEFAAGNRAVIVRNEDGTKKSYSVRLDDLIVDGDVSANVPLLPGDILIIPQSWF
ncbi:XrtA/PEP-CTERM system exopolysaccharide export protein [Sneathiella sp. HT1-7]|uniref:XrtA/PEP-CTERM system exopolysaccharide export protein n=1 Tax=Sneathiella sp. HT1-7 TaxID=2887192 RepID=UPI001D14F054|nr:XrtA/PEP-CTERM system exopolysaccharide export protein [Sneathiella sp. HT1-7]MCC3303875.1 polysaccharide export protein [Sneathiella sp. HT1-7]